MTYEGQAGRVDHSTILPHGGRVPTWTWQLVQERMTEALLLWRRSPDSDARFSLGGRISSVWQQSIDDRWALIDLVDLEAARPRALPLSRADMARMTEAAEWLRFVPEADRRLAVLVLTYLAKGEKKVPWLKLKRRLGVQFGADGLRKRYSRAITEVAKALNMAENREGSMSRGQTTQPSEKTMSATQPD